MKRLWLFMAWVATIFAWLGSLAASQQVYSFSTNANKLLGVIFPHKITPDFIFNSYAYKDRRKEMESLTDVARDYDFMYNMFGQPSSAVNFGGDNIESLYLGIKRTNGLFWQMTTNLGIVSGLVSNLSREHLTFTNVLEKMLFQRDLHQLSAILLSMKRTAPRSLVTETIDPLLSEVAPLFLRTLLSDAEVTELRSSLPRFVHDSFVIENDYDGKRNYLPEVVIRERADWYEMVFATNSFHFLNFEGRSFVRIHAKVPGMTRSEFYSFWDDIFAAHGPEVTIHRNVPRLPERSEFVLIRTIGVFDANLGYVDTGYPEEILIRAFKTSKAKLDTTTSDYKGTLFYQYKLTRTALLVDQKWLGLVRIAEDEPSFYGFMQSAPDKRNSSNYGLMTMRANCITCHGQVFYGSSTIFSFGNKRKLDDSNLYEGGGLMKIDGQSKYRLKSEVSGYLAEYLARKAGAGK